MRLDVRIQQNYPSLSRSLIQKLIKNGYVLVNGVPVTKTGDMIADKDAVIVQTDILREPKSELHFDVLYEDENCVVVNKPAGTLTHSKGAFNPEQTVASWLKTRAFYAFPKDAERGGIVHRLDRATSGVIICAKNKLTLGLLQKQFQNRTVKKEYLAKVSGQPDPDHAILRLPLERNPKKPQTFRVHANGKDAETEYNIEKAGKRHSLVRLTPKTGRTHQLRVHLAYIKHPIAGDIFYGGEQADRLFLHAKSLEITVPGGVRKNFVAEPPKNFYMDLD